MYDWIWHRLPGRTAAKVAQAMVLTALAVALLFRFVFPWVEPRLPWNRTVVGSAPSAPPAVPGPGGTRAGSAPPAAPDPAGSLP